MIAATILAALIIGGGCCLCIAGRQSDHERRLGIYE